MKYLVFILAALYLAGCVTTKEIEKDKQNNPASDSLNKSEALAQSHFIDGTMLEMKGNYASAILEFQDALKYDDDPGIHYALAKNYYRLGRLANSLEHAEAAVIQDSMNVDYNYLLATVYESADKKDSANVVYERIISADSTEYNAYFHLAQNYEKQKPSRALEIYENLLDNLGPDWNVLVKIADLNERMGNNDKTIETVERLLELNPSNLDLQKILIEAYINNAMYEEALKLSNETIEVFPEDINLLESKARALIGLERIEEAGEVYKSLVSQPQVPFEAKVAFGSLLIQRAMVDSTIKDMAIDYLEAVDKDSSDWQVKSYLAEGYLSDGKDSLAFRYFNEATALASWNVQLWVRYCGLLYDNQMLDEAEHQLGHALEKFPDHFALNLMAGLVLSQSDENNKAAMHLQKAVDTDPNNFTANYAYSFVLQKLGKTDDAIMFVNRAIKIDETIPDLWGMLGSLYDSKENFEKSDEAFERALMMDSTNALILNNYAYSLSERGVQLERALEMVTTALDSVPDNTSYLDTKGWVYYKLGEYDKAEEFIKKALDAGSESAEVYDHLGDVYFRKGDKQNAVESWRKALEYEPDNSDIEKKIETGGL